MGIIFNLFNMHSSLYLCVCGDDRIIYYSRADVLIGEPGDAWDWRVGSCYGLLKIWILMYLCFGTLAMFGFY